MEVFFQNLPASRVAQHQRAPSEEEAVRAARGEVRRTGKPVFVFKLIKIVQPKATPVEVLTPEEPE